VAGYRAALDVAGNPSPASAAEAKFSVHYVVSHALMYGSVRLGAFEPARMAEGALRDLMAKVTLREDAELTRAFPAQRAARVTVTLDDGRRLEHFAPYRKGDPEAPLSDADIDAKLDELAGPVVGAAAVRALRDRLWQLEKLDVADLRLAHRAGRDGEPRPDPKLEQ
jgi:2-methylcitrate dehydratase PrpD